MNKIYFTVLLIFGTNLIFSQEQKCNCIEELKNTAGLIINSKSYKTQIKKRNKKTDLKEWENEIKQEIKNDSLIQFFCVGYLQKFISYINDRHNQIYFIPNDISANVPTYSKTIDTAQILNDGISGIYYAGSDKVLVEKIDENTWVGITLKSNSDEWTKGKIRLRINKTSNGEFELFEFYKNGLLFYQKNIKISKGRIHSTFWNKNDNYFFIKKHNNNFTYKPINSSFDYVGIKTLKRTTKLMKEADNFYDNNLEKLTKKNLIVDLRNNGGGSIKQVKSLIKNLKRNDYIKNIFVIINFKTASAAELTVLELKEDERTIIVGENSKGMLEYGYGNRAFSTTTNCSGFKVVLSTKHANSEFSKYEYKGIKPDFKLNNNSNWIEQIVNLEITKK